MLGLNEAIRRAVRYLLRSPAPLLPGVGSMLGSPSASSSQPEPEPSGGLSLARNDRPFQACHCEVVVSDLPFLAPAGLPPGPFGLCPFASRFPVTRRRIAPVARLPTGGSGCVPNLHSPLGVFMPLGIEAFNPTRSPMVHHRGTPDFPSLPAAATFYGFGIRHAL